MLMLAGDNLAGKIISGGDRNENINSFYPHCISSSCSRSARICRAGSGYGAGDSDLGTLSETVEVNELSEVADKMDAEETKEDCTNGADDDGDTKIDCDDTDCAESPNCRSGY